MVIKKKKMYIYIISMVLLIACEITATIVIHKYILRTQSDDIRDVVIRDADAIVALTKTSYADLDYILKRNVGLFQINGIYVSLSSYKIYLGSNILPNSLAVQYQRWIPKILHSERDLYEEYGKNNVSPNFEITTFSGSSLTNLTWSRTPNMTEYYSLMLSDPPLPNSIPSGGDFATSRTFEIFMKALEFNAPYLTSRIGLFLFLNKPNYGIEYYTPVYDQSNNSSSLLGFVQLLYVPSIIMNNILNFSKNTEKIEFMIFDMNADNNESIIYIDENKYSYIKGYNDISKINAKYVEIRDFPFVNREYRFVFIFTDMFVDSFDDFFPESVIIFLTLLFVLFDIIVVAIVWTIHRNYIFRKQESFNIMAAHTSHELRNPLNVIKNFVEFAIEDLNEYKKTHDKDTDIEIINDTLEKLKTVSKKTLSIDIILADSLIVHQLQQHSIKIISSVFKLNDLVQDLEVAINSKLHEKQTVKLIINVNDPEIILNTDYQHLQQILINLMINAIKFSENSDIILKTSYENESILFEVIDNGCGIPLDKQKDIFKPFYQLKMKQHLGGIGMGLYISKWLSEILGYTLWFRSHEKEDKTWETIFSLLVPLTLTIKPEEPQQNESSV
jgi:signal transduction histidine kinase